MTTSDIVAKPWNLCNILKDDGVTYHQYVTELTYLLFWAWPFSAPPRVCRHGWAGAARPRRR